MSRENNPLTIYLTDEEKAQLEEWADETGKSLSALGREAILEYTDRDRSRRIEDKLDRVLDTLGEQDSHTHKAETPMNQASDSLEKAREMVRRIQSNHDEAVKDEDVVRAIEDIAGVDDRTIRKYKGIFRKRGLLFEHPGETPLWTTESDLWFEWMDTYANLNGSDAAEAVAEEYPATVTTTFDGTVSIELAEVEQ
jgi:hypothetical protein